LGSFLLRDKLFYLFCNIYYERKLQPIKYFSKTIILTARLNYKYFIISKRAKENFFV